MTELEIEKSKNAQLLTSNVLLRGEIVALKEALAKARRECELLLRDLDCVERRQNEPDPNDMDDGRTQRERDEEEKGEHDADCERDGH